MSSAHAASDHIPLLTTTAEDAGKRFKERLRCIPNCSDDRRMNVGVITLRTNTDLQSPTLSGFHNDRADKLREDLAQAIECDDVVHIQTLATALDQIPNGSLAKSGWGP